ncbi:hypothetical protein C8J48_3662 [Desmospora activa DSM 45169]|uniref:Uncharacterized protein n=1 Tax=Desmospora activa DSM 45169 TaxID=1121389 RepID=A0A2T4Z0Q8_9BACL|nr:hypothetical protein C8J48_3662 [Desmospora activa DSM 45169]
MNNFHNLPRWFQRIIPLISVILSVLTFSYVSYLYNHTALEFVHWIRMIIFTVIGIGLLLSAVIYVYNQETAWKWLKGGLTLLAILLLLPLIMLLMNVIKTAIQAVF